MFFDRMKELCDKKGVSAYKACTDVGLNRAAVAKWKKGSTPNGQTLSKLAEYFDVTTDYLLGDDIKKDPAGQGEVKVTEKDIKFALFDGDEDIPEEVYEDVKRYAAFLKEKYKAKF